ncbi:aminoglycoside phosphotransferase family protein [Micromonospora krabiensis]|uniref:Predicted kinase, aminoglycoside phosphotransferase (APT) family n=1 Tax=Micromonospora krabiensis TaxID=307121 RepID=A0A1C3MZQ4_9ACTN|nr:aminoglycoside phosphotransferase family protein [Micromonospora krabiensis]SBV25812.1 Predicted kinase, aminoglycoside phosphotransferase (APT) family [Micromonospora krabiensis]
MGDEIAIADRIDTALVRRLVAAQFPRWAHLPVRPVTDGGWDNRTFRLGDAMTVRLPSAEGYAPQVAKEQRWLPLLAPHLPLPVPTPLAEGAPDEGYPFPWSVHRWIDGKVAHPDRIADLTAFAVDLAHFLAALQAVDPTGGPAAGAHSAWRGAPLATYDVDTRRALDRLGDRVPADEATEIWTAALDATWAGPPVWFHGDVAVGNLLVRDGRLAAVIDFGCCGVGDPACDVVIAWTLLHGASRAAFRETLAVDEATWARGRGWALWKALITLDNPDRVKAAGARHALDEVLAEWQASR